MRINSFFYTIGQGFKNLGRNKWYTLASIATIGACLFLFGLVFSIINNIQYFVHTAEEGVSVTVFFNEGVNEDQILAVKSDLEKRPEVREINYIDPEAAWEDFKKDYIGEYTDGFTENPLADSASLEIYLNDVSMQAALVTYIESLDVVRTVNRSEITADTLSGLNKLMAYVSMGIIVILLLVSIFLISNTVTMGIAVRKDEINIMKYIGATDFFVRAPFVVEGIIIGIIGSLIPLLILYYVYGSAIDYVHTQFAMLSNILPFLPVEQIYNELVPISMAIGIGIGFLGSFTTVRKHLHV
ncbi:permease-like cell division protein FtsX [Butyrivibrio sp. M55]|jgi:cell division transport system permease protein|uniref:permease-like cell division protein FtsX n=1 Tax=Butyrivibrio sp. M55 TaxID=1855323 RepID=UPI0008EB889E|nr:permease-like cell division protein FtsX [Butyrivibrio sp. M55]SFU72792.1 cell division transport system permease protein [Butyrivibrio sp. M55]